MRDTVRDFKAAKIIIIRVLERRSQHTKKTVLQSEYTRRANVYMHATLSDDGEEGEEGKIK